MRLNNEQLRGLIEELEPFFQTELQRKIVLDNAFGHDPELLAASQLKVTSHRQFIWLLVAQFNDKELRTRSGELALVRLLKSLRDDEQANGTLAALQPYIDLLSIPTTTPQSDVARPPNKTAVQSGGPITSHGGHNEHTRKRRHRSSFKHRIRKLAAVLRWQIVAAFVLVVVTVSVAAVIVSAIDANARVQESLSNVKRVSTTFSAHPFTQLTLADFDRLQASVTDLAQTLDSARQQTGLLHKFASANPDLFASFSALDAANQIALAATDVLEGLRPVLFFVMQGQEQGAVAVPTSSGERIIELLRVGQGRFATAGDLLSAANTAISNLNLTNISPQLLLRVEEIKQYYSQLNSIDHLLLEAPDLMAKAFGVDEPQDYLILSENSDELRPSGGYISTFGWMRVRRFRIADFGYSPTTSLSPNPPPPEMASQLLIPDWWIQYSKPIYAAWDGSWYADFPSTARMAAWFYDNGNNPRSPVAGVVAIDITGFEKILESLGSVTVSGYDEVVTAQNFRDVVYRIRAAGKEEEAHKQFLAALYRQILSDWQTVGQERADQLLAVTLQALQEKHILLYFQDAKLNDSVNLMGWSGAQTPGGHDYLMVADANLSNKSNHSILRQLTYDAQIQSDGSLKSRVSVSEDYSADLASQDQAVRPEHYNQIDYFTTMQVFVPRGSTITGTDNVSSPLTTVNGDSLTTFVTLDEVKYDSTERFQFSYTTPVAIEAFGPYKRYRLLLQKQAGTPGDVVSVQVTLPPGAQTISVFPEPATTYTLEQPILEFHTQLLTDVWIEIIFK